MTFGRTDKAKVEPLNTLLTSVQQDSPDPGVVVVKIFTKSHYLPWGSFRYRYLDITTLSVGTLTTQFSLAQLQLYRLLLYSPSQIILPWETEGDGLKIYPVLMQTLWESSEEEHHLSLLCHCHSPLSPPIPIEMWPCKPKKHSVSASPWGNYKRLPKTRLSLNGGWPSNWKGWPRIMRTSNSRLFRDKRTNGLGLVSRWTPPSGRSSLRWFRLIQWGFFHGFSSPLPSPVLVPNAQWVRHSLPSWI